MKKILVMLLVGILIVSLAFASPITGSATAQNQAQTNTENQQQNQGDESQNQEQTQTKNLEKVKSGNYTNENGKKFQVQEKENNRIRLRVGNYSADCDCNLTQEKVQNKTRLYVKMSNGENSEIKIMPDTASETALQRLRLKVCSEENNCTIELKEVGQGEEVKLAYELKTQRQSKVFGLFKAKMQVRAEVSAENGEIIRVKKPWWAFLASEPEEN